MDPLLDDVLMCGIVGIQNLDRLPPSLALSRITTLKRKTGQQRCQCTTLRIHTRLDELLGAAQVGVAVDHSPGAGHGSNPETEEQRVAVLGGPIFGALEGGLVLFEEGSAAPFALDFGLLLRVVLDVELRGGAVGGDDSYDVLVVSWRKLNCGLLRTNECSCRCDKESAEGQSERPE